MGAEGRSSPGRGATQIDRIKQQSEDINVLTPGIGGDPPGLTWYLATGLLHDARDICELAPVFS